MQFRTQIPIFKSDQPITYESEVVSLGSCFVVNIAQKLTHFQFKNQVNPFGILFHPLAIEKLLHLAETQKTFNENDVFFHHERWHCFDAHSDLSDSDQSNLLQKLNNSVANLRFNVSEATHLIITLGTAWLYRENASGAAVANCHKLPQARFEKEILSVEAVRKSIWNTIQSVDSINSDLQIVFTVSPVRHLKDGFVENQRSKSNLIAALHEVLALESSPKITYFPSYEIMMDELRDYRFYAEDMIHPSPTAIDYIWERFTQTHISETSFPIMEQVSQLRKDFAHRPFHPNSESHQQFTAKLAEKVKTLQTQFPHMFF